MHGNGTERDILHCRPLLLSVLMDISLHDLEGEGQADDEADETREEVASASLGVDHESQHRGHDDCYHTGGPNPSEAYSGHERHNVLPDGGTMAGCTSRV